MLTENTHRGSVKGWCVGSYTAAQVQSTRACESGCASTLGRLFHDHTGFQQYWPEATEQRSSTRGCLRDIAALPKCDTSARSCDFSRLMETQAPTAFTGALERLDKAPGAEAFTIVLLVYRRLGNLVRSLHHYAGSSASALLLVWNNMDDAPSEELEHFLAAHRRLRESLSIRIVRVETNSLNNRCAHNRCMQVPTPPRCNLDLTGVAPARCATSDTESTWPAGQVLCARARSHERGCVCGRRRLV